jgi:hypothetical protein
MKGKLASAVVAADNITSLILGFLCLCLSPALPI